MRRALSFAAAVAILAATAVVAQGCSRKKRFGEECERTEDCAAGSCTPFGNVCTKPCTYDRDCGAGLICRADNSDAGNSCARPVGLAVGAGCRMSAGCSSNQCVKFLGKDEEPGLCTKFCQSAEECPEGLKICDKVPMSGLLKVCLPPELAPAGAHPPPDDQPPPQQDPPQQQQRGRRGRHRRH